MYPEYGMREDQVLCTLSGPSDVYKGDSGSPLMVMRGEGEAARWMAVGIVSWSERERVEDTHLPSEWAAVWQKTGLLAFPLFTEISGWFTRISTYCAWIAKTSGGDVECVD